MVLNPGKCCYVSFGSNSNKSNLMLEDSTNIPSVEEYIVLEVAVDNNSTFYSHLEQLCNEVENKLHGLTKIVLFLDHNQIIKYNSSN